MRRANIKKIPDDGIRDMVFKTTTQTISGREAEIINRHSEKIFNLANEIHEMFLFLHKVYNTSPSQKQFNESVKIRTMVMRCSHIKAVCLSMMKMGEKIYYKPFENYMESSPPETIDILYTFYEIIPPNIDGLRYLIANMGAFLHKIDKCKMEETLSSSLNPLLKKRRKSKYFTPEYPENWEKQKADFIGNITSLLNIFLKMVEKEDVTEIPSV